jgi:inositol transport system permease protein
VPVPVLVLLVVAVSGYIALRYTPYGRHVYAAGGNPEAARLTGLRVDRVVTSVYAIMGFLAGLAGFIQSARLSSAEATAGLGFELTVIAAVVIGGTSLMGGRGSVVRSFLGVLIITGLQTGLAHVGASEPTKRLITGAVIVLAVVADVHRGRWFAGAGRMVGRLMSLTRG